MIILRTIVSAIGRALAQFLAFWAYGDAKKKQGAAEASAEMFKQELTETLSKLQAGTVAVKSARDQMAAGVTPQDIVKANALVWKNRNPKPQTRPTNTGFRP